MSEQKLELYKEEKLVKTYRIAISKSRRTIMTGKFRILRKVKSPEITYGKRWIKIYDDYGIHGTEDETLGNEGIVTGCIKMCNKDIVELFDMVKVGTPVEIRY